MTTYLSMRAVLGGLRHRGVKLGHVLNGATEDPQPGYYPYFTDPFARTYRDGSLRFGAAARAAPLPRAGINWARAVGAHYEALASNTTFVVGGTAHVTPSGSQGAGCYLQVWERGTRTVVASWPLSAINVEQLLRYCRPAALPRTGILIPTPPW
jgi:hypothetical protein